MASCSCCTFKVLLVSFLLCACLFIVSLVLAFKVFPDVLYTEVNKGVRLEKDTEAYDRFIDLPFPLDFKVYIFNVENPQGILNGDEKPNVTEKGPYIYKQYRHKTVIYTDCDEDEIKYTQLETFKFDEEASNGLKETDVVTTLNAPLMSIYQIAERFGYLTAVVDHCIKRTFSNINYSDIFIDITVRELLFDGLYFCNNAEIEDGCSFVNDIVCKIASSRRNIDILPDNSLRFSYLNYKQKEPDGKYLVKRGIDDITTLGHIITWNDMKYTHYWGENTTCSQVKGTDSTLYPPRVEKDNSFYIFATDICSVETMLAACCYGLSNRFPDKSCKYAFRDWNNDLLNIIYVEIKYIGEDTYKGIDGYLFGVSKETLRSQTPDPKDDCYCSQLTKGVDGNDTCWLDGVIDMQTCFGAPVLFSFPHFLWAEPHYGNNVDGLKPNEDIHKIFLLVEPNTGTPLEGVKRIQLNGPIRPIFGVKDLHTATKVVLPLLWIEEGIALPQKYIDQLNEMYFDKVILLDGFRYGLIALTAVLSLVFCGLLVRTRIVEKKMLLK